jgi:hypothetical protein
MLEMAFFDPFLKQRSPQMQLVALYHLDKDVPGGF